MEENATDKVETQPDTSQADATIGAGKEGTEIKTDSSQPDQSAQDVVEKAKYEAALKQMHKASQEAAELKRQIAELQASQPIQHNTPQYAMPEVQNQQYGNMTPEQISQLESLYQMPYNQIKAQYDVSKIAATQAISQEMSAIKDLLANNQMISVKTSLKEDIDFIPEVEQEFDRLIKNVPFEQRHKFNTIQDCLSIAKAKHLEKVFDNRVALKMKEVQGQPVKSVSLEKPTTTSTSVPVKKQDVKSVLAQQSIANLKSRGYSDEEINAQLSTLI